jgi:hypothetical protein
MDSYDEILNVVFDAIREYNSQRTEPKLSPSRGTVLIGSSSTLDSVATVVFASILEEHLERRLGQAVSILDILGANGAETLDIGGLAGQVARKLGRAVA